MNWNQLLQPDRLGCPKQKTKDTSRNDFQRDFDRVVFSTFFRRLQGKTQVFPFPETDVIHTRLTHSLETASVGRSLGTIVGLKLKEKNPEINEWEIGALVAVACLAHDLGNPPLGHSGEDAIQEYFNSESGKNIITELEPEEKSDFTNFESNALGFHFLTHNIKTITDASGGLSLTLPVLSTYCKYPRTSFFPDAKKEAASEKKPGLFISDVKRYENEIADVLGIKRKNKNAWFRHPLAFLTEAADDICYTIIDFEDGYKHGLIAYDQIEDYFTKIAKDNDEPIKVGLAKIKNNHDKIGYLRSKAINSLVNQVAEAFKQKEQVLLDCTFDSTLCNTIQSEKLMQEILTISKSEIYSNRSVLQIETAGFKVIPGLLDLFLTALKEKGDAEKSNRKCKKSASKVLQIIPDHYVLDFNNNKYEAILSIVGYIAGMTDNFAVDLYKNLSGTQIP